MVWWEDRIGAFLAKVAEKQESQKVNQQEHELTSIAYINAGMARDSNTNLKSLISAYEKQTAILANNQTLFNSAMDDAAQRINVLESEVKILKRGCNYERGGNNN